MNEEMKAKYQADLAIAKAGKEAGQEGWDSIIENLEGALSGKVPEGTPVVEPSGTPDKYQQDLANIDNKPKVPEVKQEPDESKSYSQQIEHNKAILADLRGKQNRVHSSQNIVRPEQTIELNDYQKAHEKRKQLIADIRRGKTEEDSNAS